MASDPYTVPVATLDGVLRWRVAARPGTGGFTYLPDVEGDERDHLDLAQLDARARAVAAVLGSHGVAGRPVLLVYPPGLDFVVGLFGCLYAGAIAVPAYPPIPSRMDRTLPRLEAIASDAEAEVLLTTSAGTTLRSFLATQACGLGRLPWLATDEVSGDRAAGWRPPPPDAGRVAVLQYTSGSTGAPKGVEVTHANLLANCARIEASFAAGPATGVVSWLPPYHDLGLIGGIVQPVISGARATLMSPMAFLMKPARWLRAISETRATCSGGPNFAFDLCVRRILPGEREGLHLGSWSTAFTAGEPVQAVTLDRFAAAFAPCGFRRESFQPCYGLAEATLLATTAVRGRGAVRCEVDAAAMERGTVDPAAAGRRTRTLISSGRVLPGQRMAVVDPRTRRRQPPNRIGEIWLAGPSVARGYRGRPAETETTFRARLADPDDGPFLRTGDLGFVSDGELFVTGRAKDTIIVRGRNHYAEDIEATIAGVHPLLRPGCSAAFAVPSAEGERLVIVAEAAPAEPPDLGAAMASIASAVRSAHEIEPAAIVLIAPRSLPKTSSGKVQRSTCRGAYRAGQLPVVATLGGVAATD